MPTRKQRRRRQKTFRHEYEYVYVDDDGQEVEVDPTELKPERKARKAESAKGGRDAKGRTRRPPRPVQPPSWQRSGKRALLFFVVMFFAFSLVSKHASLPQRLLFSGAYSALFIPFLYLTDRFAYRTYLRRGGKPPQT